MNRSVIATLTGWLKTALPVLFLLLFCTCRVRYSPDWPGDNHLYDTINQTQYPIDTQVIVYKNPNATSTSFQNWLTALKKEQPLVRVLSACANCNTSMFLLYGPDLSNYLQSQTVGTNGGSNGGGPSGGNGPALFCKNFNLRYLPTINFDSILHIINPHPNSIGWTGPFPVNPSWPATNTTGGITVAVFDSGLEPGNPDVTTLSQSCLLTPPGANSLNGWNFAYNNANVNDDISDQHGSRVTKLIMDQARRYNSTNVNILPVKVFDSIGNGDLFHILCAISYAAHSGVKIINASFGFYHYSDPINGIKAENLMHAYLSYYLQNYGMLLVAASGNDSQTEDGIFTKTSGYTANALRNIDSNMFYPAYFAHTDTNIIAVTTAFIDSSKPSPLENISSQTVDIAANCDTVFSDTTTYAFFDPLQPLPTQPTGPYTINTITGSSFSTPIVTGRIAVFYGQLGSKPNKRIIIPFLNRVPPPNGAPPALKTYSAFIQFIMSGEIAP